MKGKVNTRFVVSLAIGAVVLFGVAVAALQLTRKSAGDLVKIGEAQMSAGKFEDAAESFSKAVNKDPTVLAYLDKWNESLSKIASPNRDKVQKLIQDLRAIKMQRAQLKQDDLDIQREYIEFSASLFQQGTLQSAQDISRLVDSAIAAATAKGVSKDKADVLRRYSGLAITRYVAETPDASKEWVERAESDLKAALAADPTDAGSAEMLMAYYESREESARNLGAMDVVDVTVAKQRAVVDSFFGSNPDDVRMAISRLRLDLRAAQQPIVRETDPVRQTELVRELGSRFKPQLDAVFAKTRDQAARVLEINHLNVLANMESIIDPASRQAATLELAERMTKARPNDVVLGLYYAEQLSSSGNRNAAIVVASGIAEKEPLPVSLDALRLFDAKVSAEANCAVWSFHTWQISKDDKDEPAATAALADMKKYRDRLEKLISKDLAPFMLVAAQIAFAEDNLAEADRMVTTYNQKTNNTSTDGLALAALTLIKRGTPGSARVPLQRLLEISPRNAAAWLMLARIEDASNNNDAAIRAYEMALRVDPQNAMAKEGLKRIAIRKGEAEIEDPVIKAISEAFKAEDGTPAQTKAIETLKGLRATYNNDVRLFIAGAGLHLRSGDRPGALATVEEGLTIHKDNETLKQMRIQLTSASPYDAEIAQVDASNLSEIEKLIAKYAIAKRYGKQQEAAAFLARANEIDPKHPGLLELNFIEAIGAKEFTKATAFVDEATSQNIDGTDGLTFKARLEDARGDVLPALQTMQSVLKNYGVPKPETWRLHGRILVHAGRTAEAIGSFENALAARASDVEAMTDLMGALISEGRSDEALARARSLEGTGITSQLFVRVWAQLEGTVGDASKAERMYRGMLRQDPNDRAITASLAGLLIRMKRFGDASATIADLRKSDDDLLAARLEASLAQEQGRIADARQIMRAFIDRHEPSTLTADPYIMLASLCGMQSEYDAAFAALEEARAYQDKSTMPADRALAEAHLRLGNFDQGIEAARRVVDAKADTPNMVYARRIIDAYLRKGQYTEAERALSMLDPIQGTDPVALLTRAGVLETKANANDTKDFSAAAQVLSQAVNKFPDSALIFLQRAQFMARHDGSSRDVLADYDKAVSLQPKSAAILRMRAGYKNSIRDTDGAIADLKQALEVAPELDDLRRALIAQLVQMGKEADASAISQTYVKTTRDPASASLEMGRLWAQLGNATESLRYYKAAFEAQQSLSTAVPVVEILMSQKPPQLAEADRIVTSLPPTILGEPAMLQTRAKLLSMQKKPAEARETLALAIKKTDQTNADLVMRWYGSASTVYTDSKDMIPFLDQLSQGILDPKWVAFFKGNVLFNDPPTREQGIGLLRGLIGTDTTIGLRVLASRALTQCLLATQKYDECVEVMKAHLQLVPEEATMANNLAYVLSENLNRPEEALPYAQRAVEAAPNQPEILDTYGAVLIKKGDLEKAIAQLKHCLELEQSPPSLAAALVHLTDALIKKGDMPSAAQAAEQFDKLIETYGQSMPRDNRDQLVAQMATLKAGITR
ncbi:MAG: tetratricopeptide repeat protein [Phycisphaerales bacterium]